MFKCTDCGLTIRKVQDIRNCGRCESSGRSASVPAHHSDSDWLTPGIIGYLLGSSSFSHHDSTPQGDVFQGGGGDFSGAGASGSFDAPDSSSSSDSSSRDSGSSSSDSSSDSGGSSSSE